VEHIHGLGIRVKGERSPFVSLRGEYGGGQANTKSALVRGSLNLTDPGDDYGRDSRRHNRGHEIVQSASPRRRSKNKLLGEWKTRPLAWIRGRPVGQTCVPT